jgi:class 3 adenylate cyclase
VVLGILSFQLFLQSVWIPVLAPAIAMVAMEGAMTAYRAQRAHRQQQMVMTLLGQNTSPAVAQALWQNRDHLLQSGKLPGQKLTATLLFSDLQNFSAIAEQMPPEQLLNWLNEYLGAMTEEVQRHDGIINKFTGDGLMAVFGVPVERLDAAEIATDAQNAVLCALKMGERLQELHTEWQVRHLPPVQMRIGIYTGPIVAGSLGSKERLEYGVIGDSVNIASRLESCEKDRQPGICRILITDDTLQYLTADFKIEAWGPMALKGRQQLVQVHRVVGLAESLLPASPENAEPEKNAKNAKA